MSLTQMILKYRNNDINLKGCVHKSCVTLPYIGDDTVFMQATLDIDIYRETKYQQKRRKNQWLNELKESTNIFLLKSDGQRCSNNKPQLINVFVFLSITALPLLELD